MSKEPREPRELRTTEAGARILLAIPGWLLLIVGVVLIVAGVGPARTVEVIAGGVLILFGGLLLVAAAVLGMW